MRPRQDKPAGRSTQPGSPQADASERATLAVESHSVADTIGIGAALGRACEPNDVIALSGPLGAGKTHLVKGLAEGLGVVDRGQVTSPTFVLMQQYEGRLPIRHLDAYRLGGAEELWDIGFEEMCRSGGVVVVEWAERAVDAFPADVLWVVIEPTGQQHRRLRLRATGERSAGLLQRAAKCIDAQEG